MLPIFFLYLFRFVFGCIDTTRKPRKGEQNEKGEIMRILLLATSLTNRCLGFVVWFTSKSQGLVCDRYWINYLSLEKRTN